MSTLIRLCYATVITFSLLPLAVLSQTLLTASATKTENIHPERIVVTGTRTPKLLSNSPVNVEVISQHELELVSQGTLAQALNFIPGVVVVRNQKDGFNVQMQGFDGDNVLVLVNSQPLVSPTGSSVDLDQVSSQNIDQIEIIRGAASVMYGSSAMGGVINIITREPDEDQIKLNYEVASYLNNRIAGDELSHQLKLNSSLVRNDWNSYFNVLAADSAGFDYDDDQSRTAVGSMQKVFVHLGSNGQLFHNKLGLGYQYLGEDKNKNTGIIAGQSGYSKYASTVSRHQFDLHLGNDVFDKSKHEIASTSWQLNTRLLAHQETSGNTASLRTADIGLYDINGQYVWSIKQLEIVTGGVVHQDTLEQIKLANGNAEVPFVSKESFEGFSQINWIDPRFQVLLGVRAQTDSDFGHHHAFRASGMVNLLESDDKLQMRFGIGQGYRVPTLKERFYEFDHSALGYKVYGSQQLEPESSVSYNASLMLKQNINHSWLGSFDAQNSINIYVTDAHNLIDTFYDTQRSIDENLDISVYGNVQQADIKGVDYSTKLSFNRWVAQLNYSYLEAKDHNNIRLENRPTHQVKGSLGFNHDLLRLDAVLYFVYQQGEAVPTEFTAEPINNEWTTVDFKVSQHLTQDFSWRLSIENIFDVHQSIDANNYSAFDARPISSRHISLGFQYQM